MRVAQVDRHGANAIWSVMSPLTRCLLSEGHQVAWVRMKDVVRRETMAPPAGTEVFDLEVCRKSNPLDLLRQSTQFASGFSSWLETWRPDIVHTHFAIPGVVARRIARRRGCCVVATQHEMFGSMNPVLRLAVRWAAPCADATTYVSRAVAASFGQDAPIAADLPEAALPPRHLVIYNSIDSEEIESARRSAPARDPLRVVCVGRLVPEKGQRLLIDAWPEIIRQCPGLSLQFIGSGPDEQRLRDRVRAGGLESSVSFAGWLPKDETLRRVAAAGLAVQPSDGTQEGFGLSVAEAVAVGTPVLASDIPVFREVIRPGRDAMFFNKGDQSDLVDHIVNWHRGADGMGSIAGAAPAPICDGPSNARLFLKVYESALAGKSIRAS